MQKQLRSTQNAVTDFERIDDLSVGIEISIHELCLIGQGKGNASV
jgi:hypothetical protein